jgi:hypothetical protein
MVGGNLSWDITSWFSIQAGYKYWYWDHEDSGNQFNSLIQKVYGPVAGLQFTL